MSSFVFLCESLIMPGKESFQREGLMHNTELTVDDVVLSSESPFCDTAVCKELNGQCVSHCSYVLGDGVPTCPLEKKSRRNVSITLDTVVPV